MGGGGSCPALSWDGRNAEWSGLQISFRPPPPLFFSLFSSFLSVIQRVHGEEKEGALGGRGGRICVFAGEEKKRFPTSQQLQEFFEIPAP